MLSSQINYTCTNLAEHFENLDHNSIYRYLKTEKLSPRLLWEKVKDTIVYSPRGAIIFDDTVLDKSHSFAIEGVRRQYSGTEHAVIKGIGLVNCVYYNPDVDRFWVLITSNHCRILHTEPCFVPPQKIAVSGQLSAISIFILSGRRRGDITNSLS